MAALLNSTPTKILRGIYQQTLHRAPSLEMGSIVSQTLTLAGTSSENPPIQQDAIDDFEAWFVSVSFISPLFSLPTS
jgi:hypothetical protein